MLELGSGPVHLVCEPGSGATTMCLSVASSVLATGNRVIWLGREMPDSTRASQILAHLDEEQIERLILIDFKDALLERIMALKSLLSKLNTHDLIIVDQWCPNEGRTPASDIDAVELICKTNTNCSILLTSPYYEDASGEGEFKIRGDSRLSQFTRSVVMKKHPNRDGYRLIDDTDQTVVKLQENGFVPA